MIGLDTTAIIDLFKGVEGIRKVLQQLKGPFASTQINYAELMFGLNPKDSRSAKEEEYYDEMFQSLTMLKLTKESSKKATEIYWYLKGIGKAIEPFDCMIAAIHIVNGVDSIITKNIKHFHNIRGLKVIVY